MLQLLCNIGWHHGTWTYVPESCDQVNTCRHAVSNAPESSTTCEIGSPMDYSIDFCKVCRVGSVYVAINGKGSGSPLSLPPETSPAKVRVLRYNL